jgi:hypothetical protein
MRVLDPENIQGFGLAAIDATRQAPVGKAEYLYGNRLTLG